MAILNQQIGIEAFQYRFAVYDATVLVHLARFGRSAQSEVGEAVSIPLCT